MAKGYTVTTELRVNARDNTLPFRGVFFLEVWGAREGTRKAYSNEVVAPITYLAFRIFLFDLLSGKVIFSSSSRQERPRQVDSVSRLSAGREVTTTTIYHYTEPEDSLNMP